MMDTLRPIEFIMPNSILLLTEWHTKNLSDNENNNITFSMEHLYLLINWFLKQLFPNNGLPESLIDNEYFVERPLDIIEENKLEIIDHYGYVIILLLSLLLMAIFVPIIWLMCWCFCCTNSPSSSLKHNNKNNKRSRVNNYNNEIRHVHQHSSRTSSSSIDNYEGRCDCCLRPILSIILLLLLIISLLFIICSFVTNDQLNDGINNLPMAANNSLNDFELYLNNTEYELDILFKTNFAQLQTKIEKNLDQSGKIVMNELSIISKANSIDNLTEIVSNLQPILQDLKKLINHTNELKFLTVQLRGKISRIKQDIDDFFKLCKHKICRELEEKYQQIKQSLQLSTRIENLPRLSPIIDKLQYLLDNNIVDEILKGKNRLNMISNDIQMKVNDILPQIRTNLSQIQQLLITNVNNINQLLSNQPIQYIRFIQERYLLKLMELIINYNQYIHVIGLLTIIILIIILICYFFSLLSNICNDQPTRFNYRQNCHRRRTKKADCFTYIGMTIFFLCFTIILSISTISFIFGGINDRSICFYLQNVSSQNNEQSNNLIQNLIQMKLFDNDNDNDNDELNESNEMKKMFEYLETIDIIDLINRCHQNQSLFNVLKLSMNQTIEIDSKKIHLSELIQLKENNNYLKNYLISLLLQRINNINPTTNNILLLTTNAKDLLNILKETSLETLNFSAFANSIRNSFIGIDFELLAKKLENESNRLPEYEIENIARLRNIVMDLRSTKELINNIQHKIDNLTKNAERIERKSHFNGKTLRETLNQLLQQAQEAQQFINHKGRQEIRNVLRKYIDDLIQLLTQYNEHVEQRVKNEIGRCEPVSRAYNHTVSALCDNVILPFTACWFSVTITLLTFIPSTLLICLLNSMFKRIKRSSRRESILIIDHFDDDDIPLAEIDKDHHHHHHHHHHRSSRSNHHHTSSSSSSSSGTINRRSVIPSAPHLSAFNDQQHSAEEEQISWSPGAIPQHLYSRPPPYNF